MGIRARDGLNKDALSAVQQRSLDLIRQHDVNPGAIAYQCHRVLIFPNFRGQSDVGRHGDTSVKHSCLLLLQVEDPSVSYPLRLNLADFLLCL